MTETRSIKTLMPLFLFAACFAALYYPVVHSLVGDWATDDNYSHGFLIPLISGFLLYQNRKEIAAAAISPSNIGALLLAGSLMIYIAACVGAELFTMRFSMILVILSGSVFLAGWKITGLIFLPVIYLSFMIPLPAIIWNKIAFPLKLYATGIAINVIQFLNMPVYGEGNVIHLPNTTLEVVDACSGLRSLTSLLALSGAFALISDHPRWKKAILFLSAVPIAIMVNILRLTITAVLARSYGSQVAEGFLHEASGILVFVLAFFLLYAVHVLMVKMAGKRR